MRSLFRFTLGILKHPSEAFPRLRELARIARAPSVTRSIAVRRRQVSVVPVEETDELGEALVDIYRRNPSPFVSGPRTLEELNDRMRRGIRHYLVANEEGVFVGARCFDPKKQMLFNSVTDFPYRGRGYQMSASIAHRAKLIEEGFREFRGAVLKSNTRMQRALEAAGWELTEDPNNPNLLRTKFRVEDN